jgi:hypothetical protein
MMPDFAGRFTGEQLAALPAYLHPRLRYALISIRSDSRCEALL